MRMKKNVWVDGSLRDFNWYTQVFDQIRAHHPEYSIAIIYVYASKETVFKRARKRGEETGRYVAEKEICDSMERAPQAVKRLRDKADFVAYIRNEGPEPELTDFCDKEGHHLNDEGWEAISSRFATLNCLSSPRRHQDSVQRLLSRKGITLFSKV